MPIYLYRGIDDFLRALEKITPGLSMHTVIRLEREYGIPASHLPIKINPSSINYKNTEKFCTQSIYLSPVCRQLKPGL